MPKATRVLSTPPANTPTDTTRRRLLTVAVAGAAALALPPTAAAALEADPIFAAIERYNGAAAAHLAAIDELALLEKIHGVELADGSITEKPCCDEDDAFEALLAAAATTLPGLLAKLDYIRDLAEQQAWMLDEREGAAISLSESFAESINNIWGVRS
jgi:hypothetical protein